MRSDKRLGAQAALQMEDMVGRSPSQHIAALVTDVPDPIDAFTYSLRRKERRGNGGGVPSVLCLRFDRRNAAMMIYACGE